MRIEISGVPSGSRRRYIRHWGRRRDILYEEVEEPEEPEEDADGQRDDSKESNTHRTVDWRTREARFHGRSTGMTRTQSTLYIVEGVNISGNILFLCLVPAQADILSRRTLGSARAHRLPLLPIEKRLLFDMHGRFRLAQQAQHGWHYQIDYSLMDWAKGTHEFNNNFKNRLLPEKTFRRPMRTESGSCSTCTGASGCPSKLSTVGITR